MERLALTIPDMWADHHVLAARQALAGMAGVADLRASAQDFRLEVTFDPTRTSAAAVAEALAAAGYPPGESPAAEPPHRDKPDWAGGPRVTATDADDLAMSGDYRKY